MRDITEVIDKILLLVPYDRDYEELRVQLQAIKNRKRTYYAPEGEWWSWVWLGKILTAYLAERDSRWKVKIAEIMSGEVTDEAPISNGGVKYFLFNEKKERTGWVIFVKFGEVEKVAIIDDETRIIYLMDKVEYWEYNPNPNAMPYNEKA